MNKTFLGYLIVCSNRRNLANFDDRNTVKIVTPIDYLGTAEIAGSGLLWKCCSIFLL